MSNNNLNTKSNDPFFTKKIATGYDASAEDDVIIVSLMENGSSSYRPGSNFSLEFETISASNKRSKISIPLNRNLAHYLAMMLSENLEHIYEKDCENNAYEYSQIFNHAQKNEELMDLTQEAEEFRNNIKNLKVLK